MVLAAHLLWMAVLGTVNAVADITPVESLYLDGVHDGGDYDSLIQPLVLSLAGLPDTPVPVLAPLRPMLTRAIVVVPPDLPAPAHRTAASRAPPAP
jgi:hypothetical protein